MCLEISINPEYEKLLPKLTGEEFEALKASIKNDGQLYPIIVNQKGVILDGHNRYHAIMDLSLSINSIAPVIVVRKFDDPLLEKKFVIEVNLKRRHLSPYQKAEMGMVLMEIEKLLAKERLKTAGKPLASGDATGKVSEKLAEKVGVSSATFERAKAVMDSKPSEEAKTKLRNDDWSVNYGYMGYKALDEIDDKEKRKELKKAFEADEISAPQLVDIKNKTTLAKEMIESRCPAEHKKEITEKYEPVFYTPDVEKSLRDLDLDLQKAGGVVDLKEVEVSKEVIKTKSEAEIFFKKRKGFLEGETCYWKGKVDPTVKDD